MKRWWVELQIAWVRGAAPLMVSAGALAAALLFGLWRLSSVQPPPAAAAGLAARGPQSSAESALQPPVRSNAERLAAFEEVLGAAGELDRHLRAIFAAAKRRGVALELGEYRLQPDAAGRFSRYTVQLPVAGPFTAIQGFAQQVLLDLPFAALEEMNLQRETSDAPVVEARLRFVLYLVQESRPLAAAPAPAAQASAR